MFNIPRELLNQPNPNIRFSTAKKRKPKEERCIIITGVLWSKEAEELARGEIELMTIGKVETLLPKKLNLPRGYMMLHHKAWDKLCLQIYDESKQYSFEYMDKVSKDQMTLYDELHIDWEWVDWEGENLKEYNDHKRKIFDSWENYYINLENLEKEHNCSLNKEELAPYSIVGRLEWMLKEAKTRGW